MMHRCTTQDCPAFGQRTDRSCACHKTDEQVLVEQRDELLEACQRMVAATEADQHFIGEEHDALKAAIAKATGADRAEREAR